MAEEGEKANVNIFGQDIDQRHRRYNRDGNPIGGLLFLFAGVILLLNSMSVIGWDFWDYVWQFWPILLILLGIRMLLGRNFISTLVIFLLTLAASVYVTVYSLQKINSPMIDDIPSQITNFVDAVDNFKNTLKI